MKNFLQLINKAALKFWGCGVIRLKTFDPNKVCLKFRLFHRTIATYGKEKRKRGGKNTAERVVYLKVNRQAPYTISCVQSWLNAICCVGGGYV